MSKILISVSFRDKDDEKEKEDSEEEAQIVKAPTVDSSIQTLILAIRSLYVKNPSLELGIRVPKKYHSFLSTTKAQVFDSDATEEPYYLALDEGYDGVLLFTDSIDISKPIPKTFFEGPVLKSVQLETDMKNKTTFWLGDTDRNNTDIEAMRSLASSFCSIHSLDLKHLDLGGVEVPEEPEKTLKLDQIIPEAFSGYLFTSGYVADIFLTLSEYFSSLDKEREKMRRKKGGLGDYFFNRGAFKKEEKSFGEFFRRKGISLFDGRREILIAERQKDLKGYESCLSLATASYRLDSEESRE